MSARLFWSVADHWRAWCLHQRKRRMMNRHGTRADRTSSSSIPAPIENGTPIGKAEWQERTQRQDQEIVQKEKLGLA